MLFSSPLFLFAFLPCVLLLHAVLRGVRARNALLLVASLLFYAWGEPLGLLVLLASTLVNWAFGLRIGAAAGRRRDWLTGCAIAFNLAALAYYKYADFAIASLNTVLHPAGIGTLPLPGVILPIGVSFFTFHAITYIVGVARGQNPAVRDPSEVALYIFFFPQLVAGPIIRYYDVAAQFHERKVDWDNFAYGVRRFAEGLAKKVFIANAAALPADALFKANAAEALSSGAAWLGLACYTVQIYFDFSGYSDMAVGLGRMFGFRFKENFAWPYSARSVQEFWRRWHMSLSTWFRDYVYIPMGGNRGGEARTLRNLLFVFVLCGLWHGASWTFVVWGLFHGVFLVLERSRFGGWIAALPSPFRSAYTLLVVACGWVFFRCESFGHAMAYFGALVGMGSGTEVVAGHVNRGVHLALALGAILSFPVWPGLRGRWEAAMQKHSRWAPLAWSVDSARVIALFFVSAVWLAGGTYNPFIYFRF
jgi:alginate O-acetyltransferase complex protein AlgI